MKAGLHDHGKQIRPGMYIVAIQGVAVIGQDKETLDAIIENSGRSADITFSKSAVAEEGFYCNACWDEHGSEWQRSLVECCECEENVMPTDGVYDEENDAMFFCTRTSALSHRHLVKSRGPFRGGHCTALP